jgi:hypothetical protein
VTNEGGQVLWDFHLFLLLNVIFISDSLMMTDDSIRLRSLDGRTGFRIPIRHPAGDSIRTVAVIYSRGLVSIRLKLCRLVKVGFHIGYAICCEKWRRDTQHNDAQHNDTKHYDLQHNNK